MTLLLLYNSNNAGAFVPLVIPMSEKFPARHTGLFADRSPTNGFPQRHQGEAK